MGILELLLICAVVLLIFGATRLPGLVRSAGQTAGEFKAGLDRGPEIQPERRDV